jgi:pSer/pThr/pTyr-binding forkhead associated (FHA) protein
MSITPTGDGAGALAVFSVEVGPQAGEEVPIRLPVVTIGRGSQNDVVLADDSVSTVHARLEYADGAWRLTDLDSTNGTYVDGMRLAPQVPTPLADGAAVRFGGARLQFRAVAESDPEAARTAYTPPPAATPIRERRGGVRIPVWLVVLLLVLIALAVLLFGWLWTEPVAQPPAPAALLTLPWSPAGPAPPLP